MWKKKDPVINFEKQLLDNNVLSESEISEIKKEIDQEVSEAHVFANNSPYPEEEDLAKYVFKGQDFTAESQRAQRSDLPEGLGSISFRPLSEKK